MIVWTDQAVRQLEQAWDHIGLSNSEDVADRIIARILISVQRLDTFPMSGRTGRVSGTRELVIARLPFIAAYTVDGDRVVILAVYHSSRQWPEAF